MHDASKPLIIPSGFFVFVVSSEGTFGLRWSFTADDSDKIRVVKSLDAIVSSVKDCVREHHQFLEYLRA